MPRPCHHAEGCTTISAFNLDVYKLVPALFQRFPQVNAVEITGIGKFTSIRGQESEQPFMRVTFTRSNSATIKWDKITFDNVPKLAE